MNWKRKIAGIISVILIFSCVLGGSDRYVNASNVKYSVNFGSGTWTVGGTTVTASMETVSSGNASVSGGNVSGGDVTVSSENVSGVRTLSENDMITLSGFNAATMEVRLTTDGGFSTTLQVTNGKTSLSARDSETLPDGVLTFSVVEKSDSGNGGTTGGGDEGNGGTTGGGDEGNGGITGGGDEGNGGTTGGGDEGNGGTTDGDDDGDNFADVTKPENNACGAGLKEPPKGLIGKLLEPEEKERMENGEEVKVFLEVSDISGHVGKTDKDLIEGKKGSTSVGMYLNIDLFKQVGADEPVTIKETNGTVTIELKIPDALINTNSSVTRGYQVLRIHEGVVELLSSVYDAASGIISFETDQFSTYAIVYADYPKSSDSGSTSGGSISSTSTASTTANELDTVPGTGDDSLYIPWEMVVLVMGVAVMAFAGRMYILRRKTR